MATKANTPKARLAVILTLTDGTTRAYHTVPVRDDADAAAARAETIRVAAETKTGLAATVVPYLCGA